MGSGEALINGLGAVEKGAFQHDAPENSTSLRPEMRHWKYARCSDMGRTVCVQLKAGRESKGATPLGVRGEASAKQLGGRKKGFLRPTRRETTT